MSGYTGQILLVVVLMILNALFAGSEMALVTLRDAQIQRLEQTSRGGAVLAKLARDPNRFLATIQIGITLAGFLASATAAVSLSEPLVGPLSFLGSAAGPVAIVLVTIILTFVTLVVGELAPKRIAMQRAEGWAIIAARPLDLLATLSRPVVWLLGKTSDLIVRIFGVDPNAAKEEVSAEEIRDLVAGQQQFTAEQRTIIDGAFEIAQRLTREILVPRRDVVSLSSTLTPQDALDTLISSGHSRAPVVGKAGLDDIIGIVHIRDLIGVGGSLTDRARPCLILPDSLKVTDALRQMRDSREHFAGIVDEYGSIDGILTLEDLVEEIVGEIYDETDRDVLTVIRNPDGTLILPGSFPLHDLTDIDVDIDLPEHSDYTTVAGLLLDHLGHIAAVGDRIEVHGHQFEVTQTDRHAIIQLQIRPPVTPDEEVTDSSN
ncbi:hemolysin family protein [Stackebrandtia soli]|uniref:hemolysin family protein n=1 Tax=Stackebrandtia soli TaxID=1892856 RepID=UPI0039ECB68E